MDAEVLTSPTKHRLISPSLLDPKTRLLFLCRIGCSILGKYRSTKFFGSIPRRILLEISIRPCQELFLWRLSICIDTKGTKKAA